MAIIALSRGTYTGAEALAHQLAERLQYPYLSREQAVAGAAAMYHIPVEEFEAAMQRRPSFWGRTLGPQIAFLPAMRATLCAHVQQDNLVYSGYGGHFLLPGISHVLAIRVVAEPESRVRVVMQRENLSRSQALAKLEKEDRTRHEWARFLFGVEWQDPSLYHLVVSLSRLGLESAAAAVARLAETPQFQPSPASRTALQNLGLQNRVLARLAMDFRTRDAHLKVSVDDGTVTVSGTTRWFEVAEAVPKVVRQVEGVKDVRSHIAGGTPPPGLTWY